MKKKPSLREISQMVSDCFRSAKCTDTGILDMVNGLLQVSGVTRERDGIKITPPSSLSEPLQQRLGKKVQQLTDYQRQTLYQILSKEDRLQPLASILQLLPLNTIGKEQPVPETEEDLRKGFLGLYREDLPHELYYILRDIVGASMCYREPNGAITVLFDLSQITTEIRARLIVKLHDVTPRAFAQFQSFLSAGTYKVLQQLRRSPKLVQPRPGIIPPLPETNDETVALLRRMCAQGQNPPGDLQPNPIECLRYFEQLTPSHPAIGHFEKLLWQYGTTAPSGEKEGSLGTLETLQNFICEYPPEAQALLVQMRQEMKNSAMAALQTFAPDPDLTNLKLADVVPGFSEKTDGPVVRANVASALIIRCKLLMTFLQSTGNLRVLPEGPLAVCMNRIASSVCQSLVIDFLRRRWPAIFPDYLAFRELPIEQRRQVLVSLRSWLTGVVATIDTMRQELDGRTIPPLHSQSLTHQLQELSASITSLIDNQEWGLDQETINPLSPQNVELPRSFPELLYLRHEGARGQLRETNLWHSLGPQVLQKVHIEGKFSKRVALWQVGDKPCHSHLTVVPLGRLLPPGTGLVRDSEAMAASAQQDLYNAMKAMHSAGLDHFYAGLADTGLPLYLEEHISAHPSEKPTVQECGVFLTDAQLPYLSKLARERTTRKMPKSLKMTKAFPSFRPFESEEYTNYISVTQAESPDIAEDGALRDKVKGLLNIFKPQGNFHQNEFDELLRAAGIGFEWSDGGKGRSDHFAFYNLQDNRRRSSESRPLKTGLWYRTLVVQILMATGDLEMLENWLRDKGYRMS